MKDTRRYSVVLFTKGFIEANLLKINRHVLCQIVRKYDCTEALWVYHMSSISQEEFSSNFLSKICKQGKTHSLP